MVLFYLWSNLRYIALLQGLIGYATLCKMYVLLDGYQN